MKLTLLAAATSLIACAHGAATRHVARDDDYSQLEELIAQAQAVTTQTLESDDNTKRTVGSWSGNCTLQNLSIRREWGTLSKQERKAYTDAVVCLQNKATKTPASFAPGAKNRFDDWVATHISQSLTIHYTGTFLGWHRWFTWLYEQALRDECGYTGTQPYWDWALTANTGLEASPIFDGSDYSLGGNGAKIQQTGDIVLGGSGLPYLTLPTGTGGGCIYNGPFKNMKVNMGPASLSVPGNITIASANPLAYNPRCLKRDLTDAINSRYANVTSILNTIKQKAIYDFEMIMQGIPGSGDIGVHGGGHYSFGGDPGRDVFVSPGEPAFYLHHSNIDRTWWMWQALDPLNRVYGNNAIAGTNTFLNIPPSDNTTFDTQINMNYVTDKVVVMRDLMSTISGPFCYMYA